MPRSRPIRAGDADTSGGACSTAERATGHGLLTFFACGEEAPRKAARSARALLGLTPGTSIPVGENGTPNELEFTVSEEGTYSGQCAEFCGAFHDDMTFSVEAMSRSRTVGSCEITIITRAWLVMNVHVLI